MVRALRDADIEASEVNYLNAHGTSTPYNDRTETKAIKLALESLTLKIGDAPFA